MQTSNTYGCLLTATYSWSANAAASGKAGTPQQAFKYSSHGLAAVGGVEANYPYDVVQTRLRVRGNGNVVVLRYESEEGKDFELLGHTTTFNTTGE